MLLSSMSYFRSGGTIRLKADVCYADVSDLAMDIKEVAQAHPEFSVKSVTVVLEELTVGEEIKIGEGDVSLL